MTQVATSPGQTVGISVFVDHLIADLDLTRSAVATAYLIGTGCGAVSMPAADRLIDRRGLRWATTFFGGSFAVVLVAMSGIAGSAVGPVLLSVMNDASGSYTTGVLAFSAVSGLVALAIVAFVPRSGPTPTTVQRRSPT